ncbi:hypothetical protein, partial [Rufibacter sediminis]|uniref:hypothetical protein n=1 Tax=Rufibacter sediminis TaxID=2762756 RepID=UPI0019D65C5A
DGKRCIWIALQRLLKQYSSPAFWGSFPENRPETVIPFENLTWVLWLPRAISIFGAENRGAFAARRNPFKEAL